MLTLQERLRKVTALEARFDDPDRWSSCAWRTTDGKSSCLVGGWMLLDGVDPCPDLSGLAPYSKAIVLDTAIRERARALLEVTLTLTLYGPLIGKTAIELNDSDGYDAVMSVLRETRRRLEAEVLRLTESEPALA